MSDIFDEVEQSVRQDKLETMWKRYRLFVYGAAVLLIGGVAVNEFVIRPAAETARAERAKSIETAITQLDNGDYKDAQDGFKALADGGTKLSSLAGNYLAQSLYEGSGDAKGAAAALAAAGNAEGDPFARLALLKSAYAQADSLTLPELETALASLKGEESTLGALSRELIAAKAFASGDAARARTEYNRLKFDASAPEGLQRRAEVALAAIPVPAAEEVSEPAPAPEPAETVEPAEEPGQ